MPIVRLSSIVRLVFVLFVALFNVAPGAEAHESRPAYLQITETAPSQFELLWRTPLRGSMPLPVVLTLPEGVRDIRDPLIQTLSDSRLEHRWIDAGPDGLAGKRIGFPGLELTITEAVVRTQLLDGRSWIKIARPTRPWVEIDATRSMWAVAGDFLRQGVEHILFGVDHLLFVLGLLLIVQSRWMLVKTITAFTVAHSITLAAATLGYAHVPAPPLNAAIALSILFVGIEVVRSRRGETSFTLRHPWVVAFAFGLLHGFGFASGLVTLGLPNRDIPLALLSFNVGVEIGQLAFVAGVFLLERAFRVLEIHWPAAVRALPAYVVGTLGAYWTIDRVVAMLGGMG